MTECQYKGCDRDSVGTVEWDTSDGEYSIERDYCQKHLRDTRVDFPDLIGEVKLT